MSSEMEDVKCLLRGLLISSPREVTLEILRRDYRLQEGRDIPYSRFGFNTLMDFLKAIPDVLTVSSHESPVRIFPVVSEKTAHVEALVLKQKVSKAVGRYVAPPRRRRANMAGPPTPYEHFQSSFRSNYPVSQRREPMSYAASLQRGEVTCSGAPPQRWEPNYSVASPQRWETTCNGAPPQRRESTYRGASPERRKQSYSDTSPHSMAVTNTNSAAMNSFAPPYSKALSNSVTSPGSGAATNNIAASISGTVGNRGTAPNGGVETNCVTPSKFGAVTSFSDRKPQLEPFVPANMQCSFHKLLAQHPEGLSLQVIQKELCDNYPLEKIGIFGGAKELVELLPHLATFSNGVVVSVVGNSQTIKDVCSPNRPREADRDEPTRTQFTGNLKPADRADPVKCLPRRHVYTDDAGAKAPERTFLEQRVPFLPDSYEINAERALKWPRSNSKTEEQRGAVKRKSEEPMGEEYWNGATSGNISPVIANAAPLPKMVDSSAPQERRRNNPIINDRVINNFFKILDEHPNGIWCAELPTMYKLLCGGAPLHFNILGYTSMAEMAADLPEVFHVVRPGGSDFMLLDARKDLPDRFAPHTIFGENYDEDHQYLNVPSVIRRNIEYLLRGYTNGVEADLLLSQYEEYFETSLSIQRMGFNTLQNFLYYLKEQSVVRLEEGKNVNGEPVVYVLPRAQDDQQDDPTEEPLPAIPPLNFAEFDLRNSFPPHVVGPDDEIPQLQLPAWVKQRSYVEVYVGEVRTPNCFWVQLRGNQYFDALDKLMDDMQAHYVLHAHELIMPTETIGSGQYCACLYDNDWHRARISKVISLVEVEVVYIDFGTNGKVKSKALRFLPKEFASIPAQAIQCGLTNMRPAQGLTAWPLDACKRFLELVSDKGLIGIVASIDPQVNRRRTGRKAVFAMVATISRESGSFTAALVDTSGKDDVDINDILVQEGYAEYKIYKEDPCKVQAEQKPMVEPTVTRKTTLALSTATVVKPEPQLPPSITAKELQPTANKSPLSASANIFIPSSLHPIKGIHTGSRFNRPVTSQTVPAVEATNPSSPTSPRPPPAKRPTPQPPDTTQSLCGPQLLVPDSQPPMASQALPDSQPPAATRTTPSLQPVAASQALPDSQPPAVNQALPDSQPLAATRRIPGLQPRVPPGFSASQLTHGLPNQDFIPLSTTTLHLDGEDSKRNPVKACPMNIGQWQVPAMGNIPPMTVNAISCNDTFRNANFQTLNSMGISQPRTSYTPMSPIDVLNLHQQMYLDQIRHQTYLEHVRQQHLLMQQQQMLMLNAPGITNMFCNQPSIVNSLLSSPLVLTTPGNRPTPDNLPLPPFPPSVGLSEVSSTPTQLTPSPSPSVHMTSSDSLSPMPMPTETQEISETQPHIDPCVIKFGRIIQNSESNDKSPTNLNNKDCSDESPANFNNTMLNNNTDVQDENLLTEEAIEQFQTLNLACDSLTEGENEVENSTSMTSFESADNMSSCHHSEDEDIIFRSDSEDLQLDDEDDDDADVVVEEVKEEVAQLVPHCVQEKVINGKEVHLLNLDGEAYLLMDEFVPLFTVFTSRHAVVKILDSINVSIPFREVGRREWPQLYAALEAINLPCLKKSSTGAIYGRLQLIALNSVPRLLSKLNQKDPNNFHALQDEIEKFDPKNVYWVGNNSSSY